ncbi:HEAT repeat domain-containing protein, partial [Paenibacillus polymyxa]|uniref:HEAT repeat domain-containing protein n=2 Tax=Paenibacillus polymyxa TaxID=1406 RepID=UPI001C67A28C
GYLCSDFSNNLFENTSGNGDQLLLAKQVLARHSEHCSPPIFDLLEKTVISYVSPLAKKLYQHRIDFNRENNDRIVYWSFWGDLQKEILEVLPINRLSKKAKDLVHVLKRRFSNETTLYKYSNGHGGFVSSPVTGKKLSNKKWIEILTNNKLRKKHISRWNEVPGGFIESSIESFSSTFSTAVSEEPERMIKLMLSCNDTILDMYIDSLFSGVAHSKILTNVPLELLEAMILKFSFDFTSYRASSICTIIENRDEVGWSQEVLDFLKSIAINHKNPEIGKPNVTNNDDKEMRSFDMLQSNAINCVRGRAVRAIAQLLWKNSNFFKQFKDTIKKLISDENPAVRLASLSALWPSYNIDRDWASEKILCLYEQDYRLAGFHDTKNMFFLLYPQYRQRIINIINQCYNSEDERLIRTGAHCLSEMFILKNEFVGEMTNVDYMSKLQAEGILDMVMLYFNKEEYNTLVKSIILRFKTSTLDLEMPISRLFYDNLINLERDRNFLIELMCSDLSRRTLHAFVHYLEEEAKSVVEYKDIILSMSHHLIQNNTKKYEGAWGIHDEISKLVIGLYDETSEDSRPEIKCIAQECLDIWDLMFEKQIGPVRRLSHEMMER